MASANGFRVEPSGRWVRADLDGDVVVDSRRVLLVWEAGSMIPVYAFPREDVRRELLEARPEVARTLPQVPGHVVVDWKAMDRWYEEDEEVIGHPRDPYHRVDVLTSSRHVQIVVGGEVVAESRRPRLLFETGLPTRYYLPKLDVRLDLMTPSSTVTRCPYKGVASYWAATVGGRTHPDVAWAYPDPLPESQKIRGHLSFYDDRVDLVVDGERLGRPRTPGSED